jgi:hypothetical protein
MDSITKNKTKLEKEGYIGKKHAPLIKATVAEMYKRKRRTFVQWVKGHD